MEGGALRPMWLYPELLEGDPPERWGHSGCYSEGKLYIYGGCSGGLHFSDVLMVDLKDMSWKSLPTTGDDPGNCDSHTSVIHDRKMVVFGGTNGTSKRNDVHILDLETLVWTRPTVQGVAPAPRESHTSTLVNKAQMVVFGGSGPGEKRYLNDVHVFDIETLEWTSPDIKGTLPAWRDSHSAVVVGRQLIVYGGDCGDRYLGDLDVLDLETFVWSKLTVTSAARPGVRAGHTAVVVDGKMFVFGGVGDRTYYNDLWMLDVENRVWCQLGVDDPHPQGRFSHVAILAENNVLIYGGCGEDERPLNEFLVLHISKEDHHGVWTFLDNQYDLQKLKNEHHGTGIMRRRSGSSTRVFVKNTNLVRNQEDVARRCTLALKQHEITKRRKLSREFESSDIPKSLQIQLPSTPYVSRSLVGSELRGTVDGVFDSGYLMTAQLNGQVLRGVLFSPGSSSPALPSLRRLQNGAVACGFTTHRLMQPTTLSHLHENQEEDLTLGLSLRMAL